MRVIASIIGEFNAWLKPIKMKKCRVLQQPSFPLGWPIGYFDWVVQKGSCGVGFFPESKWGRGYKGPG